jgi:hypothetical protein
MRALMTVLAGAAFLTASAFAADMQPIKVAQNTVTKTVARSVDKKPAQRAPKVAQVDAPVRVWTVEMACCEPQ